MLFSVIEYDPSFTAVNVEPTTAFVAAVAAQAARGTDVGKYLKSDTKILKNTGFVNLQG